MKKLQVHEKFAIMQKKESGMKKGFTLSELLLSLAIIGVVATLTVPVLMNNVYNKTFANQVKNMSATIEQLAQDELIAHRTRDLSDTDFSDSTKLLSDNHFSIAKTCTADNAATKCWKISASGKEKITYKNLNKQVITFGCAETIILKNGVILMSNPSAATTYPNFVTKIFIDVNGNDKPNIAGRDFFAFYVDTKGHVVDLPNELTLEQKISTCKTNSYPAEYCYGALSDGGWKMDY